MQYSTSLFSQILQVVPRYEFMRLAKEHGGERQTKGAIKLHLLLDHDGYFPEFAIITVGKATDVRTARQFPLPAGSIVTLDRVYCDYGLFWHWPRSGIYFVTRLKHNSLYEVMEERSVPPESDLRAATIAALYRDRWEIELFFKVLKHHLKIKTFVGVSPKALKIQIWTALIAVLLIKYLPFRSRCQLALCRLVARRRLNLFSYRHLWLWLDNPFETPPEEPERQLALIF